VSGPGHPPTRPGAGDEDEHSARETATSPDGASTDGASPDARGRPPKPVRVVARLGLAARGLFYLLLAGLAVNLVTGAGRDRGGSGQANANGALTQVAQTPIGLALLAGAALGFAVYAVVRLRGAVTDHRHGTIRRVSTAGQALLYLAMAAATASFLLGRRSTGSEQQQHSTAATLIGLPFGRIVLAGVGVLVLGMCAWQLVVAARAHFAETLRNDRMGPVAHRVTMLTARIGIPARALAIVPIGVFLVVAAVRADPSQAKGLDAVLLELSRSTAGRLLGVLAAVGFAVFAVYSLLEARYRQVSSGA
jgi:Domain of Unknown Function (DUF1206)